MAPFFSVVQDVNPSKTYWAMRLRLVRTYEVPVFGKKDEISSVECVFHDKNGERIHASIKGATMQNMKDKMLEGHLYAIKNFIVAENRMKFQTTKNKFKILFFKKTSVVEIFDPDFPSCMYQFKSFNDFAADREIHEFHLFDIIGKVVSYQLPTMQSTSNRRIDFRLEDLEKNRMTCTLWEEYADHLRPFIEKESKSPIVVIIQFGKAKLFGDEVNFSNTYNVTKIIVNGDDAEFQHFAQRLVEDGDTKNSIGTFLSKSITSISEDFRNGTVVVKNLAEISNFRGDGVFWVAATIIDIETDRDWCYLACKRCSKKLIPDSDQFLCSKCGIKGTSGLYRYKMEVRVIDETGNARFLMWDKECCALIGKTASDIKLQNLQAVNSIPKEIEEALTDRIGLFKIQVNADAQQRYSVVYSVLKMTADDSILSIYYQKYTSSQECNGISKKHDIISNEVENAAIRNGENDAEFKNDDMMMKRPLIEEFSNTIGTKKKPKITKQDA